MIQRIQSLWLLLAAICVGLTFQFPFYSGTRMLGEPPQPTPNVEMTATFNVPIIIFMVIAIVGAVHAIFSYAKRKYQMMIVIFSLIASIISLVLLFIASKDFMNGRIALTAALSLAVPVFLFLAMSGIRRDEKLVKSMDRLR